MSIEQQVELECPNCHEKQVTTVWRSINVQVNPEAKQELLDSKINVLHCRKCGNQANIVTELLYHDMEKQFWVEYHPFDEVMSENLLEHFSPEGEIRSEDPNLIGGYISRPPHIVFDMNELVRYVLFRNRLFEQSQTKQHTPLRGSLAAADAPSVRRVRRIRKVVE